MLSRRLARKFGWLRSPNHLLLLCDHSTCLYVDFCSVARAANDLATIPACRWKGALCREWALRRKRRRKRKRALCRKGAGTSHLRLWCARVSATRTSRHDSPCRPARCGDTAQRTVQRKHTRTLLLWHGAYRALLTLVCADALRLCGVVCENFVCLIAALRHFGFRPRFWEISNPNQLSDTLRHTRSCVKKARHAFLYNEHVSST